MSETEHGKVLNAIQDDDYETALNHIDSEEDTNFYAEVEALNRLTKPGEDKLSDTQIRVVSNYQDRIIQQLARRIHGKKPLTVTQSHTREWLRDVAAIAENHVDKQNPRQTVCSMLKTAVKDERPIVLTTDQEELQKGEIF